MIGEFETDLDVVKLRAPRRCWERARWKLLQPLVFTTRLGVAQEMRIVVPAGWDTDFASVPRLVLTFAIAGDTGHSGAVIHDWLYYQHLNRVPEAKNVTRRFADDMLYWGARADGESWFNAFALWFGVRIGGWWHWYQVGRKIAFWRS